MELLSVMGARSMWFIDPLDLNPRGKSLFPDIIHWLKDTYKFAKVPSDMNDVDDTKGLAFSNGTFKTIGGNSIAVSLTFYNDGFKGDTCSSTKDTDAFLGDALASAATQFGLSYTPEMVRKKLYQSQLNVRCNRPLVVLNPELKTFCDKLSSLTIQRDPSPIFELSGLRFWTETTVLSGLAVNIADFRFERKLTFPFSENRYFSVAPFDTDNHLSILQELESILAE